MLGVSILPTLGLIFDFEIVPTVWILPINFRFVRPSGFRGEVFRNQPIRNKNCLWWPSLLKEWDEMSNVYREPSINASYQVSFIWPSGFREDFF
jgi:hypothetical protein